VNSGLCTQSDRSIQGRFGFVAAISTILLLLLSCQFD
jgi:hypothetical protein